MCKYAKIIFNQKKNSFNSKILDNVFFKFIIISFEVEFLINYEEFGFIIVLLVRKFHEIMKKKKKNIVFVVDYGISL